MKKNKIGNHIIRSIIYSLPIIDILINCCMARGGSLSSVPNVESILLNSGIISYKSLEPFNTIFNSFNSVIFNVSNTNLLFFIESYFVYIIILFVLELLLDLILYLPRLCHSKIEKD